MKTNGIIQNSIVHKVNGSFSAEKLRKAAETLHKDIPLKRLKEYFEQDEAARK